MSWLKVLHQFQLEIRIKLHRARVKAAGGIYEILPFEEIEKKYLGRALNYQIYNWRTLFQEEGKVYYFFEAKGNEHLRKVGKEPVRKVFLANNALVFSDQGIVSNTYYNCAVLESVETWGEDTNTSGRIGLIQKKPTRVLNGLSLSLLTLGADTNYAHFLFDGLSRLALSKSVSVEPQWYLVSGPEKEWKKKILSSLQILDKVVWVGETDEVQCEQLLFTSRLSLSRHTTPYGAKAVRNLFMKEDHGQQTERTRMIFASRRNSKIRVTPIEEKILALLPKSVEVIEFETLSMEETFRLCKECKLFFGLHGAAFSNVIFCEPGTRVVEFQLEGLLHEENQNYFQVTCETLQLEHTYHRIKETISEGELTRLVEKIIS
jgi:capsular polysaccharide biosynthesis protein